MVGTGSASLPLTLFVAGLAGSLVHCAGMCGPFVLGQLMVDAERPRVGGYGEWQRLAGAALMPYHLGRLTTYVLLGAAAGTATAVFVSTGIFSWLSAVLLFTAALLLIAQAFGMAIGTGTPLAQVTRLAGPLAVSTTPLARYALGVVLGFLPCGLLYAAIAAAAGTASAAEGALALAAFGLGTVPALVLVAWGGLVMRRRLRAAARWVSAPLLAGNALVMLTLASQRV